MNDQLDRPKNKGMTNSKNHAFLNCPANQTGAVGGTPPTRGVIGGQFKKGTWVSAFDAALEGLPSAIKGDQCLHLGAPNRYAAVNHGSGRKSANTGDSQADEGHGLQRGQNAPSAMCRGGCSQEEASDGKGAVRHGSCPLLLCGAALWLFDFSNGRIELAYRLDAGVSGQALPDIPERVERNLGSGGEGLNLRVAQGSEVRPDLFGRG